MRLGKIVELSAVEPEYGFEVLYGIDMDESARIDYGFGSIVSAGSYTKTTHVTYIYSYFLRKNQDSFKEYIITTESNPHKKPNSKLEEEYLLVFIPYSSGIKTKSRKLAGRNSTEAILEMKVGETVTVKKADAFETYMVVKAGNELFLVKKNR